jgi:glyoxylase-like metal-dependent hydrolase (beta-lactamase superfamily II)
MGLGLSVEQLARDAGLEARDVTGLERGERAPTLKEVEAIGSVLRLRPRPLAEIARHTWAPAPSPSSLSDGEQVGVETIVGDIGGYAVKGYMIYDEPAREAVLVDTAYSPDAMLQALLRRHLELKAICLTHGHADHADGLDKILHRWPVPVYLGHEDERLLSWRPHREHLRDPVEGTRIAVGRLSVRCLPTPGHTPGGICYRVEGFTRPVCFVGDTLFAGSIGRSNPFGLYPRHLRSVQETVLRLPETTVLFPGHGPATTVAEELVHNPFRRVSE